MNPENNPTYARIRKDLGTHFYQEGKTFVAFHPEKCDKCGAMTQVNGIGVHESKTKLLGFGMEFVQERPEEMFYDEETDKCVCESCA